jgi:hypothetical protein
MVQTVEMVGIGSAVTIAVAAACERRSHWFTLLLAAACIGVAGCGFLIGFWVVGVAGFVGYLVAMRRWVERQERDE